MGVNEKMWRCVPTEDWVQWQLNLSSLITITVLKITLTWNGIQVWRDLDFHLTAILIFLSCRNICKQR